MRIRIVFLACLSLAGCTLIDQRTFAPSPEAPTPPSTATPSPTLKVDTRTPLLTIGYDVPDPHYQEVLRYAVQQAERRAPHVEYDVVAIVPTGGDIAQAQRNATEVMRVILAQRVPDSRVHLGLRTDAVGTPREVRVYVR
jgi:hypothetical protein